ncbi:MAG: Cna B-type domain-containing protein, partial [Clostridia bacterium]|nr:Cna B-type domain-containing protein [Clostridia bacterium]
MKKLLFVLLMVLSLVISLPAQAAVETLADFDFDSEANYADGGNAKAVVYSGSPVWKAEHEGREGVMYFDGSSGLSITKGDGSPLLTNVTDLTVSFDACYTSSSGDNHWVFLAIPSGHSQNPWWSKHVGISETNSAIRLERPLDAGSDSNALTVQGITTGAWHHIEAHFTSSGMSLYVDGDLKGTNSNANDLTSLLGSSSQILLGVGNWGNNINWYDPDFTGYIDNFKITGEKSIRAALNPFNNFGGRLPALYDDMKLLVKGSDDALGRIVFPVAEGAKITLPSEDSLRSGFTIGDTTYVLEGELENPRKLIGWYNIADGKYYSVLKGDAKNVTLTGNNDVFYGDWIASSYDFLGGNTDGLITTADTSDFIDVNVFDYSELVNVNSMIVQPNGVSSEGWKIDNDVVKDWLSFSDWGTYQTEGSLGFPFNRPANSANGLMDVDKGPYEDLLTKSIIEHLFNQNSVPGKGTYVPGINYLGKGNYLFSYDPATSMYSYDCSNNAAVYQQSEKRFYVYDSAIDYISNVNQTPSHNPDFFPLNKKTDNLTQVNGVPNYWFGLNAEVDFWLPDNSGIVKDGKPVSNQVTNADGTTSDMIFNFNGDDDMWVLIDDEVVLDIGGVHAPIEGSINFSTGLVETFYYSNGSKVVYSSKTNKFTAGDHTLKIYYLERGGDLSNCKIEFNLLPEYEVEDPGIDTVKIVKKWENVPTGFKLPADLTVELYDGDNRIKTATLTQDNNWSHSFSNLTPAQSEDGYSVKEPSPGDDFLVNVIPDSEVYDIAWVFTDMAGLANGKEIVIGDSKGHVLGADLNAHDVAIDEVFNIITKIADNEAAEKALKWTVDLAEAYTGGKHFYLKNKDGKYLCIKLPTSEEPDANPYLHLHDTAAQASIFYLNASGDLQDATTGHRLIATDDDKHFGVATNKGGNVTIESAEKATLYVKRESKTTAYSFIITNTYVDPTVPMGTLQISKTIGGNAADADDEFTFLITLKDEKGSLVTGTFGNHEFKNGQCEVTLKGNESVTMTLPIGVTYTVTEEPTAGYVQTAPTAPATGVISTEPSVVSFTNVRDVVRLVKVTDPTGLTVAPKVTVTGSDGSVVTTEALTANNAAKYLEIPVKPGVTYTVAESGTDIPGYAFVGSELTAKDAEVAGSGMTFTVGKSGLTTIPVLTLTNTYAQGGLTVKKTIGGNAADENDVFTFTVTLTDKDGKPVSGTFDTHTFVDGKYTFTLKGNESENFADLPIGVTYTVTEEPTAGYVQTAPTEPATGVISTEAAVVSFTNVRDVVRLVKVTDPTG